MRPRGPELNQRMQVHTTVISGHGILQQTCRRLPGTSNNPHPQRVDRVPLVLTERAIRLRQHREVHTSRKAWIIPSFRWH